MKPTTILAGSLVAASQFFGALALSPDKVINVPNRIVPRADKATQTPKAEPVPGSMTSQGCWESRGNFTVAKLKASGVSSGSCRVYCQDNDFPVMGLSGQQCLCGNVYPEKGSDTKDSNCNYGCPAYPLEACGGLGSPGYVSVFNLGTEVNVENYVEEKDDEDDDDKNDKKTASSSAAGPTSTSPSDSAEETAAPSSAPADGEEEEKKKDDGGGINVAGVVAGCVVGVLAVVGGAGAAWFFMRRRRNTEIEEEHRRNAAVNAFISGSKPPGSSGSISMTDSRLDPVMGHRRLSNGSIDDNQDYSRKILRVSPSTNKHLNQLLISIGYQRMSYLLHEE